MAGERIDPADFEGLRAVGTASLAAFDLGTPLVCAVNGHARALGCDLLLAAELRYAVPHATFALEEVARGLYPTGHATVMLARQVGWVHAHDLLLTARPIDAQRAAEIGLVNRVVPADALLDTAKADDTTIATQGYGVGNYFFVTGNAAKAKEVFQKVTSGGGWNAFGFIAAEADLARMK